MDQKMYQKYCDDAKCGFLVKSHSKDEVVDMLRMHAKNVHDLDVAKEKIAQKVEEV